MYIMNLSVSVIIPFFNNGKTISRCIESVQKQSLNSIEILLIDDGSDDNSCDIASKYAAKDSRIKLIKKEHGGVSSTRNVGIKNSIGEYIAFIDADDTILSEMYETLYTKAKIQNADLVITGMMINQKSRCDLNWSDNHYMDRQEIERCFLPKYLGSDKNYRGNNTISPGSTRLLYKSELIKTNNLEFNEEIGYYEDLLFNLTVLNKTTSLVVDKNYFYNYYYDTKARFRRHSLTKKILSYHRLLDEIELLSCKSTSKIDFLSTINYKVTELSISCTYFSIISPDQSFNEKITFVNHILSNNIIIECLKINTDLTLVQNVYRRLILSKNIICLFIISYLRYFKEILRR